MSDIPGEKVGNFGPFASNETGERVAVPVTVWSPVFGAVQAQQLSADVPDRGIASAPGAVTQGWAGPCSYRHVDLAQLRPGSGSAPDGRLQAQADAVEASGRGDPELGQAGSRAQDFTQKPISPPSARATPPG
jgi:hypothetical protein